MSAVFWNASVVDSPDSEPYTVVGDVVLVVRTPRSRDFVTVEVGRTSRCLVDLPHSTNELMSPEPLPILTDPWCGEVRTGDTVDFRLGGEAYHLTLTRLTESPAGSPWVTCDFRLERD